MIFAQKIVIGTIKGFSLRLGSELQVLRPHRNVAVKR